MSDPYDYSADVEAIRPKLLSKGQLRFIGLLHRRKEAILARRGAMRRGDRKRAARAIRDIDIEIWSIRNGWST